MNTLASSWVRIFDMTVLHKAMLVVVVFALAAVVSVLPLTYAMLAVGGLCAVFILLLRPEYGLWLLIISVPYGSFREGDTGGLDLSLTEPLVGVVVFFWLLKCLRERRVVIDFGPLYFPLFLFLGLVVFSLSTAPSLALGLKELLKWAALLAAYIFVVSTTRNRRQVALALAFIFVAALSEAALGFYQFIAKAGPKGFAVGTFLRAFGTFGQPNPYAGYLAMCAVAAFGVMLFSIRAWFSGPAAVQPHSKWLVVISWATFVGCIGAIVMSLSRGALLGLVVGLMAVMAVSSRRALFVMLVMLTILALVLGLGVLQMLPAQMTDRVSEAVSYFGVFDVRDVKLTPDNWSLVERMAMWQAAWYMYEDSPLLGVGIGNYVEAYKDYFLPGWKKPQGHAHNYYLNTLAEMGTVGLIAYVLLLVTFFGHAIRVMRRLARSPEYQFERYIVIGLVGTLVALSVHNIFDVLFVHGIGVQIALIMGLVSVLGKLVKQDNLPATQGGV